MGVAQQRRGDRVIARQARRQMYTADQVEWRERELHIERQRLEKQVADQAAEIEQLRAQVAGLESERTINAALSELLEQAKAKATHYRQLWMMAGEKHRKAQAAHQRLSEIVRAHVPPERWRQWRQAAEQTSREAS